MGGDDKYSFRYVEFILFMGFVSGYLNDSLDLEKRLDQGKS